MNLPFDILSRTYTKPRIFLCETDKTKICILETTNTNATLKFNGLSELSFDVARTYNDNLTGEILVHPYYNKIESPRLIFVDGFGYFEIQSVNLTSDGIKECKNITAYSAEYVLSTKYLETFYINTGEVHSMEVVYADENNKSLQPITLYNENNHKLSLLHLAIEKAYGWTIGTVDKSLATLSRSFEVDRESIYDFLMNEVCEKFNCYIVFDTINNTINVHAEALTDKFIGDGTTTKFIISPKFYDVKTVSVDGYKTTKYSYDPSTGNLTLDDPPASGAHIEVIEAYQTHLETDVYISFANLSQEVNVDYNLDDIKTVLSIKYGEDNDIREINLGLPYLTDLSFYHTPDWMGQDLYDAYTEYLQKVNEKQIEYTDNSELMNEWASKISHEETMLSVEYSLAENVTSETMGTYYERGGSAADYYYTEVTLPEDYRAGVDYYSLDTANVNTNKVSNLYTVLKHYYDGDEDWEDELSELSNEFKFMQDYDYTFDNLRSDLKQYIDNEEKRDNAVVTFLITMWGEVGRMPLKEIYRAKYAKVQSTNIDWSQPGHANYWNYYPVVLMLQSLDTVIAERDRTIASYTTEYERYQKMNQDIVNDLMMTNPDNFTSGQLARLNAFLREDELTLDDIVETAHDTLDDSFKIKKDAMESGKIELHKISQPKLQFSMTMANIYALPEFAPIVKQFQLGNIIKVGIRPDYLKQSRLLQVNLNFDNLSNFSCEFGELTVMRTQSDIHADLLAGAISAGKSVAANSNYWTRGSDKASSIDLRLQEGLLNSIEALKDIDGNQHAFLDKYGLHLEAVDDLGNTLDERVWLVNNQIVFTDDAFKTSKAVLGKFQIPGEDHPRWGLLADAVIAGYVEGSTIKGGIIDIGDGAFVVDSNGNVTMGGDNVINGKKASDIVTTVNDVRQYFGFSPETGLTIAQNITQDENNVQHKFAVNLQAEQLMFKDNETPMVIIGNTDSVVNNLTVRSSIQRAGDDQGLIVEEGCDTLLNGNLTMRGKDTDGNTYNFIWKVETNGSLSLAAQHY